MTDGFEGRIKNAKATRAGQKMELVKVSEKYAMQNTTRTQSFIGNPTTSFT
jgi:hypothetical protein